MTYQYPTILAVYIVLGIFTVELQSEKTSAYEKGLLKRLLQALLKKSSRFGNFLARTTISHFFFHRFGLQQFLGN